MELSHRLAQHNSPRFRSRYPSLQYHVMELENMESAFVALASSLPAESGYQCSLINIIEMLGCRILQTLDDRDLRKYLSRILGSTSRFPFGSNPQRVGQRTSGMDTDPFLRQGPLTRTLKAPQSSPYVRHISKVTTDLSGNALSTFALLQLPSHRAYYYDVKRKQNLAASAVRKARLHKASRGVKSYRCQTRPVYYSALYLCWFFLPLVTQKLPTFVNR